MYTNEAQTISQVKYQCINFFATTVEIQHADSSTTIAMPANTGDDVEY